MKYLVFSRFRLLILYTVLSVFTSFALGADYDEYTIQPAGTDVVIVYRFGKDGSDSVFFSDKKGSKDSWKSFFYPEGITQFHVSKGATVSGSFPTRAKPINDQYEAKNWAFFVTPDKVHTFYAGYEHPKSSLKPKGDITDYNFRLTHKAFGETYSYFSLKTALEEVSSLTRVSDNKAVVVSRKFSRNVNADITDGIWKPAEKDFRAIDLLAFDQEATFVPQSDGVVTDSNDQKVSAMDYVDTIFDDLENLGEKEKQVFTESDQKVVDQLFANLRRPQRASTVLLGGAGTGKTTLVKAALKGIPRTWKVKLLNSSDLTAGARFTGMFAQRVSAIIAASKAFPIIWFADEMHTLKGEGTHSENSNDVFEKLKGALADGTIRMIGTDTPTEFYEKISDPAIIRRFTAIELQPPTPKELRLKIDLWVQREKRPPLADAVKEHLIETASDFNSTENEPSRSIGLLEAAFATIDDVKQTLTNAIIDKAAGVLYRLDPAIRDVMVMRLRLKELPEKLEKKVIGQEQLKRALIKETRKALANLHDGVGPRVSAFIAGVPGVGKTELAKAYADAMSLPYKVIEMSRFSGNGRTGEDLMAEIAQQIRANAFSVIILDEIEKAHPKVLESLLTMMSNDSFTSYEKAPGGGADRALRVSSKNASVLMTSNAGSKAMQDYFASLAPEKRDVPREQLSTVFDRAWLKAAATGAGIPEPLIDRVKIIEAAYRPTSKELHRIIDLHFQNKKTSILEKMKLDVDYADVDEMIDHLMKQYEAKGMSNRDVINEVKSFLDDRSSMILMHDDYGKTETFKVRLSPKVSEDDAVSSVKACAKAAAKP